MAHKVDSIESLARYPVTVVDKLLVNGPDADPLYKYLKAAQPVSLPNAAGKTAAQALSKDQGALEWNYTKFLCDKNGVPVKRFKSAYVFGACYLFQCIFVSQRVFNDSVFTLDCPSGTIRSSLRGTSGCCSLGRTLRRPSA
jgi:hypothetical protein